MEQQALAPFNMPLDVKMFVLVGQHTLTDKMLKLIAALSLKQTITVLDCGNRSNMYAVARHLRPFTHDPVAAMNKIRLSRAFTCYQTLAMFEALATAPATQAVLVLDLLPTFLDEDVDFVDTQRLFKRSLNCLSTLSKLVPVVISAKPIPAIAQERATLMDILRESADFYWEEPLSLANAHNFQGSLFD